MFRTIQDYFRHIFSIVDKSGLVVDRRALGRSGGKTSGQIIAPKEAGHPGIPNGLLFWDGAVLNFLEEVDILPDGGFNIIRYNYHYQRPDGYFFRYDKIPPEIAEECNEPECHLHANIEDIRFPTHSTNLEEILGDGPQFGLNFLIKQIHFFVLRIAFLVLCLLRNTQYEIRKLWDFS